MSYASLAGLPDGDLRDRSARASFVGVWHGLSGELDMLGAPLAQMHPDTWEWGDRPTHCDFASETSNVLITEYLDGQWVTREEVPAQPFPCGPECRDCAVGRIAMRVFGVRAVIEHLL